MVLNSVIGPNQDDQPYTQSTRTKTNTSQIYRNSNSSDDNDNDINVPNQVCTAQTVANVSTASTHAKIDALNILSLNVNSLTSKINLGIIQDYIVDFDIVCVQESKLDKADVLNIKLQQFEVEPIYKHRKKYKNKSGGLAIFIKDSIRPLCKEIHIDDNESDCVQWLKIDKKLLGYELVLGNIYIPPVDSGYCKGG